MSNSSSRAKRAEQCGVRREDGEAHTLRLLRELRDFAKEISDGHMDYAERFHQLLQSVQNPNLPDVAKEFGFSVRSVDPEAGGVARTVAVCVNIYIAVAAWECACKIYPNDRWLLLWGGMVQYDSGRKRQQRGNLPPTSG
jgi:hypothetical protein